MESIKQGSLAQTVSFVFALIASVIFTVNSVDLPRIKARVRNGYRYCMYGAAVVYALSLLVYKFSKYLYKAGALVGQGFYEEWYTNSNVPVESTVEVTEVPVEVESTVQVEVAGVKIVQEDSVSKPLEELVEDELRLAGLTVKVLRKMAKDSGIKYINRLSKAQIIKELQVPQEAASNPVEVVEDVESIEAALGAIVGVCVEQSTVSAEEQMNIKYLAA